jgi:hypothetical protein
MVAASNGFLCFARNRESDPVLAVGDALVRQL